jgi:hypothetical protein
MIGRVYKIVSKDKTYVGSTVLTLEERLKEHHKNYKQYLDGKDVYYSSYEVLKDEHTIQLIYECEFETERDLHRMEGKYQRKIDCVNKRIEGRTRQEYRQDNHEEMLKKEEQYRHDHKEELLEKATLYRQEHREEINKKRKGYYQEHKKVIIEKAKKKYTCACGSVCRISVKSRHERTKKHLKFIGNVSVLHQTDLPLE